MIGTNYRKRWNINPCYYLSIIEGIGSNYGLFQPSPGCFTDFATYSLTCFTQNGMTLYPDTNTNCQLIIDVENIYPENYLMTISPNPFTDKINLISNNKELSEIILYDITSRNLLQQKFTNSISLNTEQLSKGIYIYEVRNNPDKSGGVVKKGKVVKE